MEGTGRRPSLLEQIGGFFFGRRNLVFSLVLVGLLAGLRPVLAWGSVWADRWVDALGLGIILVGQSLRFAVIGYAYIVRGGRAGKVYADRLVTEGFFNHSRNPLYLGNLLVMTGLFVIHNNPWVYVLGLPFFLFAYSAIIAAEEAYLGRQFGPEYAAYCRRVPRWLPRLHGLRRSVEGMRFDWQRVVVKEYGSTYAWIGGVLALLAYEAGVGPAFPGRTSYLTALILLLALATAVWIRLRYWKKEVSDRERGVQPSARRKESRSEQTDR